jgi:hypothetical protein
LWQTWLSFIFYSTLAIYPTWFSLLLAIVPNWTVFFAALSTFNTVCVYFLFLWKKWAFCGFCGTEAIALAVKLHIGVGPISVSGVNGVVITYLVINDKWNFFDNF